MLRRAARRAASLRADEAAGPWHGPGHDMAQAMAWPRPWSGPWHGLVVRHAVAGRAMVQVPRGPPGRVAGPCVSVCVRARVRLPAAGARAGAVRPCYVLVTPISIARHE